MKTIIKLLLFTMLTLLFAHCEEEKGPFSGDSGTFKDSENGETYNWVRIGDQIWMAENLKSTQYVNGDPIPLVTDNEEWTGLTTGAYCYYENDSETNAEIYGAFYNWFAVTDNRNVCPSGWHVPTPFEWATLINYLGGDSVAGGKLKEAGFDYWEVPNHGATNESGFTALPGGFRNYDGTFFGLGSYGNWWSSSETSSVYAYSPELTHDSETITGYGMNKKLGISIRCIKD